MKKLLLILAFSLNICAQITSYPPVQSGGPPTGAAGGDLKGTYPNPGVANINSIPVTGTPLPGQVITAANATSSWQTPPAATTSQLDQLLSGCGVHYLSGLSFTVGACNYSIVGNPYNSAITNVTSGAADGTNPRIDMIIVDNTSTVSILPGIAASVPLPPNLDPSTQLEVTRYTIAANATTPTNIASLVLYDENTEWTSAVSAHLNAASTVNPYHLAKDIEATAAVLTNNFTLIDPSSATINLANYNYLVFYIRSKAVWPTGNNGSSALRTLTFQWLNASTVKGNAIVLRQGAFNFDSSITNAYQLIAIPTSLFAINGTLVTTLKVSVTGNSGTSSIGFYIDFITLQSGFSTTPPPAPTGFFPPFTPPTAVNFTWTNQLSTVVTDSFNRENFSLPTNNTDPNWRLFINNSAPSVHTTLSAAFASPLSVQTAYLDYGLVLQDSATGHFIFYGVDTSSGSVGQTYLLRKITFNSVTAVVTVTNLTAVPAPSPLLFLKIVDDGSTRHYQLSMDGWDYRDALTEATGTFIAPDRVGIGCSNFTGSTYGFTVYNYSQT